MLFYPWNYIDTELASVLEKETFSVCGGRSSLYNFRNTTILVELPILPWENDLLSCGEPFFDIYNIIRWTHKIIYLKMSLVYLAKL